jgi:protein Mpv17
MATESTHNTDEQNFWRFFNYAAVFGGIYCGMGQHFLYNTLYPRVLGVGQTMGVAGAKIATECCITNPFIAMPIYYTCKGVIEGTGSVQEGLLQYKHDFWQVFREYCMIFGPAHAVTFYVMPPQFRVGWVASVSVAYLSRLSYVSHKAELAEVSQGERDKGAATATE